MNRLIKYGLITIPVIAAFAASGFVAYAYIKANPQPYPEVSLNEVDIPQFKEVSFPFEHQYNRDKALPFLGSAIIDVDGDGTPEVFMGGGRNQEDAILEFDGSEFQDATETKGRGLTKSKPEATFGVAVTDVDADGRVDMFVARTDSVTLYLNKEDGFEAHILDIPFNAKSTPLSIALGDINADGAVDMFISNYVKIDQVEGLTNFSAGYGATSLLMLNNGDNTFRDVTKQSGVNFVKNTFTSVFSDADHDGDLDLIVAYDTGRVRTYKNKGNGSFENARNPNSGWCGYPMGVAVGDYDNNGHIDFFFSNIGYTAPSAVTRGQLPDGVFHPELMLFSNQGEFKFNDAAPDAKLAQYEFSWGSVFDDLNNDGLEDLVIAQNYIDLPTQRFFKLPGRVLMQNNKGEFGAAERQMKLVNREYEITPLLADFNNDGYRDMIRVNLAGKSRAFINGGGKNKFLKVQLPERASSIGALVEIELPDGSKRVQQFTSGEGLSSDQSHELIFGLADITAVNAVNVKFSDGRNVSHGPATSGETITIE